MNKYMSFVYAKLNLFFMIIYFINLDRNIYPTNSNANTI